MANISHCNTKSNIQINNNRSISIAMSSICKSRAVVACQKFLPNLKFKLVFFYHWFISLDIPTNSACTIGIPYSNMFFILISGVDNN